MVNVVNTIVLQTPKHAGGYGFSPKQNALCMLLTLILDVLDVPYVPFSSEELILLSQSSLQLGSASLLLS